MRTDLPHCIERCVRYSRGMHPSVSILQKLIAIPSLNPGDSPHEAWIGEARMADWLESYLGGLGFRTERLEVFPGRPNLIARLGADDPERSLMIEGHMDTVAVETMSIPPFTPEIRDGRMYGRGACDTKGPSAAALAAFTPEVLDAVRGSTRQLIYVGAVSEETGCFGAAQLAGAGIGADACIVLEPTDLLPVVAHKGPIWIKLTLHGKAGHGSQPEKGINAADCGIRFVHMVREGLDRHARSDELLGDCTMCTGIFRAGQAANIIPDVCELELDLRLTPDTDGEAMLREARNWLEQEIAMGRLLRFDWQSQICPPMFTDPASELSHQIKRALKKESRPCRATGSTWYSDAGPLAATCPEIIVFGPGSIEQAHTHNEWIDLQELQTGARVFEHLLRDFFVRQ